MLISRRGVLGVVLALPFGGYPTLAFGRSSSQVGFSGQPVARWLTDGRNMQLVEDFWYIDTAGKKWTAKKGSKTDGASIPWYLWSIAGGPFEGKYRDAAIIHDVYCQNKSENWQKTHRVFYEAMITSGVSPLEAGSKYWAVLTFGPALWRSNKNINKNGGGPLKSIDSQKALLKEAEKKISEEQLTAEGIESLALKLQ